MVSSVQLPIICRFVQIIRRLEEVVSVKLDKSTRCGEETSQHEASTATRAHTFLAIV